MFVKWNIIKHVTPHVPRPKYYHLPRSARLLEFWEDKLPPKVMTNLSHIRRIHLPPHAEPSNTKAAHNTHTQTAMRRRNCRSPVSHAMRRIALTFITKSDDKYHVIPIVANI